MFREMLLLVLALIGMACADRDLRGTSVRSRDGSTYLVVDKQNGPLCNHLYVDSQPWPHELHAAGKISPGDHKISCAADGATIAFEVKSGMIYHFNYWGP
jgi:hypothetical protein